MVSSAEAFGRFRMLDLSDTQSETQMTRLLLHSQDDCIYFPGCCHGAVGRAAAQAEADGLLRVERVLVSPLLRSLLLLCFRTDKA